MYVIQREFVGNIQGRGVCTSHPRVAVISASCGSQRSFFEWCLSCIAHSFMPQKTRGNSKAQGEGHVHEEQSSNRATYGCPE